MRRRSPLAGIGLSLVTLLLGPSAVPAAPTPVGLHTLARRAAAAPMGQVAIPQAGELQLTPRHRNLPVYPPAPRRAGLEGRVQLLGTLTAEGTIADLRCVGCEDDRAGFAAAALQAIAGWSYEPVRNAAGNPLAVSILFDVEFRP